MTSPTAQDSSLYARLGGYDAICAATDDLLARLQELGQKGCQAFATQAIGTCQQACSSRTSAPGTDAGGHARARATAGSCAGLRSSARAHAR
jgi:hypothetical protein